MRSIGGAGETPAPTVKVWMGEECRDRFRYVPLLFNALKLKGGICMLKYPYKGVVSGNARRLFLTMLISITEKELFQGTKIHWQSGQLEKEARHMKNELQFQNLLKNLIPTTHLPHGGKHPKTCRTSIEYVLANRTEECV